jgi:hypothetical protein
VWERCGREGCGRGVGEKGVGEVWERCGRGVGEKSRYLIHHPARCSDYKILNLLAEDGHITRTVGGGEIDPDTWCKGRHGGDLMGGGSRGGALSMAALTLSSLG